MAGPFLPTGRQVVLSGRVLLLSRETDLPPDMSQWRR